MHPTAPACYNAWLQIGDCLFAVGLNAQEAGRMNQILGKVCRKRKGWTARTDLQIARIIKSKCMIPAADGAPIIDAEYRIHKAPPPGASKKKSRRRKNNPKSGPVTAAQMQQDPQFQEALKLYRKMHPGADVEVTAMEAPEGTPPYTVAYGAVPEIKYDAHKRSSKGRRIHHFGRGRNNQPLLVTAPGRDGYLQLINTGRGKKFRARDWIY